MSILLLKQGPPMRSPASPGPGPGEAQEARLSSLAENGRLCASWGSWWWSSKVPREPAMVWNSASPNAVASDVLHSHQESPAKGPSMQCSHWAGCAWGMLCHAQLGSPGSACSHPVSGVLQQMQTAAHKKFPRVLQLLSMHAA